MKKVIFIILLNLAIFWGLMSLQTTANASEEYNKAVIGHVITETVKGTDIDHLGILESELEHIMKNLALEVIPLLEAALPLIMDRVMTDLRLELDKQHKCLLLKDSKIKDKDCS